MIRHDHRVFNKNKHAQFEMDEKKLVKAFIYNNRNDWIEYFTGFLFMDSDNKEEKINIKIRFSRHPHLKELQSPEIYPLDILTDQQGLYTLISEQKIKTIQKPEQKLLYLKIGDQGKIIALSFQSKGYCNTILEHFSLVLESRNEEDQTWSETNLPFLNASMKENLIYVDLTFMSQDRVDDFLNHFNQVDRALYLNPEKNQEHEKYNYMLQFFQTIKHVFTRADDKVLLCFISKKQNFETVLKCLSCSYQFYVDNPFGKYNFNYFEEFKKMTVIHSSLLNFDDQNFNQQYELITKVKFLKDVALCTFLDITTDAAFNQIISKAHITILGFLGDQQNIMIERMQQLGRKDEEKFIAIFCQIWQIFKAILEDLETTVIKETFYLKWIQRAMFSQTLSVIGRLIKNKQVSTIHPRFWQKLLESMNPMLSYEWADSQKIILNHETAAVKEDARDLMTSLAMLLADCDSNTKVLVLDFVRVQIEVSQNRKVISAKYLSYVFRNFVKRSIQHCMNEEDIEKYIEFILKIYIAEPIRTRHFIIETNFMGRLKPHLANKFVLIMALKLLKTFIEIGDDDTFRYLLTIDCFVGLRRNYAQNQHLKNITNSLFLSIFKAAENLRSQEGRNYLQKLFFSEEAKREVAQKDNQEENQKFKRSMPTSGLSGEMDIEN